MVAMLSQCESDWVWSSCTITVSTNGNTKCDIKAVGELGWRVEVKYLVEASGGIVAEEMTAVCQPLQVLINFFNVHYLNINFILQIPEVAQDKNMSTIHRLLQNLSEMSFNGNLIVNLTIANRLFVTGSQLQLSSKEDDQLIWFDRL